ncbi:unnamed protein product [Sphagnum jensenii]|uniref:Ubiquitin-like domain-containing protein n=1 Tax=Sphagnum jensenii TaxID=128206 RepID=A0ABP0VE82_9BRYO
MEPIQGNSGGTVGSGGEGLGGETIEIKIKTLDSQSYSIRVEKNVAVPVLKEQLATLVGVPAGSQRLICRGKVLKDDHLLSAYNVEDGHTLHLVARPLLPSAGGVSSTAMGPSDVVLAQPRNRAGHISHSLLMGTINIPDTGEGAMPDLSRIISAVLNTVGIANVGAQNTGETGGAHTEGRPTVGEQDSQVRALELQIDALYGVPPNNGAPGVPFRAVQQAGVVPDALTTMSQYLDRLEQSFSSHEFVSTQIPEERAGSGVSMGSDAWSGVEEGRRRPSPAALGALLQRVNNLLRGQASSALARLAEQLENEAAVTDARAREEVQHTAFNDGNLMQQIGALLLELGRTTLSLRMGQSPGEAVVNPGPAIFISPAGPNPIMVQPLPMQTSAAFPVGRLQPRPVTLAPSPAVAGTPRSIHIHIHTSDVGAPSASPSPPPPPSAEEGGHVASGVPGSGTVHQVLAHTDVSGPSRTLPDTGITIRPVNESAGGTAATPMPPAHTGVQGAIMTFDEHGAMRIVPVHSHAGSTPANPRAPFEPGTHFHPMLARFQHHFAGQPFTVSRNVAAAPLVSQPASTPPSSMETDVRGAEDPQGSSGSAEGASLQSIGEAGVVSMEINAGSEDGQIMATNAQSTSMETIQAGESNGNSGPSVVSPPIGLGLGGLQPLTRRRRPHLQQSEEQQDQAGHQAGPGDSRSQNRRSLPPAGLGNILRAAGAGSEAQQVGPGILGQLMRSPAMETLVQQVMQGVGDVEVSNGGHRAAPAAGQDLGGMLQQMMPMMSQIIGGGARSMRPPPAVATSSRSQAEGGVARDPSETERWKEVLSPVTQKLDEGEAAQEVLRSVADAAGTRVLGNTGVTTSTSLAQHVSQADGLADAYLAVLFHDLAARVASDPDFEDGSRFPSSALVFQQHPDAPTQADHD